MEVAEDVPDDAGAVRLLLRRAADDAGLGAVDDVLLARRELGEKPRLELSPSPP